MGILNLSDWRSALAPHGVALAIGLALAVFALRFLFIDTLTIDTDGFVLRWLDVLITNGPSAIGGEFVDLNGATTTAYSPPYYYFLYLGSFLDGLVPRLWIIKFITFAFEFLAAFFAFRIVRLTFSETRAWFAAAAVLAAPVTIANGAWWGQCDMIWASLLLGSFYFTLVRKPLAAVAMFTFGVAVKLQAIFFAPYLFLLLLRGEIKFWHLAVAPLFYALLMAPAVALGQSWVDVFTVYLRQSGVFQALSLNAPNLYYLIPNTLYEPGVIIGALLTTVVSAWLGWVGRTAPLSMPARVLAATMFVALSPFLLPKMLDRYFFAAEIFSIVLAFYVPRLWPIAVGFQFTSLAAYVPIITSTVFNNIKGTTLPMAAMLNTVLVAFLVYEYWRVCRRQGGQIGHGLRPFALAATTVLGASLAWQVFSLSWDVGVARICSAGAAGGLCAWDPPQNLIHAGPGSWLAFLVILAVSYFVARPLVAWVWRPSWDVPSASAT